ncbi:MAG: hypothetical protein JXD23_01205 [Spirochaetales bacterium]|nr:hypothetical protein [Spirochaetales bacterium]
MLREIKDVRQVPDDDRRRWFADDYFDLIVWYDEAGEIKGFQLCYDKAEYERALTWTAEEGFRHNRIDAGESPGRAKMTPVLTSDGLFPKDEIAERFLSEAAEIEREISAFVYNRLKSYSAA